MYVVCRLTACIFFLYDLQSLPSSQELLRISPGGRCSKASCLSHRCYTRPVIFLSPANDRVHACVPSAVWWALFPSPSTSSDHVAITSVLSFINAIKGRRQTDESFPSWAVRRAAVKMDDWSQLRYEDRPLQEETLWDALRTLINGVSLVLCRSLGNIFFLHKICIFPNGCILRTAAKTGVAYSMQLYLSLYLSCF